MKLQQLKKKAEGFTIIEVLIVLAIAGLILLIVFLAVPALQRNSRNTQARNEVGVLLAAVNEFASNNNGKVPGAWDSTDVEFQNAVGDANNTGTEPKISFYKAADINYATSIPGTLPTPDTAKVYIYAGAKCNGNTPTSAAGRAIAAYYAVEAGAGGGATAQCQEG